VDKSWYCCASDADGTNLIAGVYGERLYTSDDGGATWTERQPAGNVDKFWHCCASDADGTNLIAGVDGGRLYTSANSGVVWTERQPAGAADKSWWCCASDDDGSNLIAGIDNGRLYTSANSGANWTERQPAGDADKFWDCCASDDNGSNLIAGVYGGRLYTSDDSGATWAERTPAGNVNKTWRCCASDSDGSNLIAGVNNGRLYTGILSDIGWTYTETNAGNVTIAGNNVLDGSLSCELLTTAGGTDVAAITDSNFIPVDADNHYRLEVPVYEESGAANAEVDILCYSAAGALLGTLAMVEDYNPATSDVWIDACDIDGYSIINPVGGNAPAFPTGTVKVKRVIRNNATVASVLVVDKIRFNRVKYIPDHQSSGALTINIPPSDIEGDLPAEMDVYIDSEYDRFTDLVLGQRRRYHADFNAVQEPGGPNVVTLNGRRSEDYCYIDIPAQAILNPSFETYTGSGNTTNWGNWTETRSGITGAYLQANTAYYTQGAASAQAGRSSAGRCREYLISDLMAHNPVTTRILSFDLRRSANKGFQLTSAVYVGFYDAGSNLLGTKFVYNKTAPSAWKRFTAYIYPYDCPVGTTQIKVTWKVSGTTKGGYGYHYLDNLWLATISDYYIEAIFPLDSHRGTYIPTAGLSFGATTALDNVTLEARLQTDGGQEITPLAGLTELDLENPITAWRELVFLEERAGEFSIPSHKVSENADPEKIEQVLRFSPDSLNTEDFWYDHIALIPTDRAVVEVRNWTNSDYLILDSHSLRIFTALTSSLDTAQVFDPSNTKGSPAFVADPEGINMVLVAVKDTDGNSALSPRFGVRFRFRPRYKVS
jgi:hypothetical protein